MTTAIIIIVAALCGLAGLFVWSLCRSAAEADACRPGPILCECGAYMWWVECHVCLGEGEIDMSNFQDDCPMPEEYWIEPCGECNGNGGWWACPECEPERAEEIILSW